MKGYPTTFLALFDSVEVEQRQPITSIEIPIIQRDFAQGRPDDETTAIRERFLDAMVAAATTGDEMGLDFVYGDVNNGVLRPLDGQQRLTTLFLLHWYVASRAETLDATQPWTRFSYATRPTARDFTETIVENPYPAKAQTPTQWITDQPWYVHPWRQDPTISSMLVMLEEIHNRFESRNTDFKLVWETLSNRTDRAIWFLFLPIPDMEYGEDLYIKMNSRGKPLTRYEVFKADLQGVLKPVLSPERFEHLTTSFDQSWADLLWEYEKTSGDFVIDDEFERYLRFIIDVCEWRDAQPGRRWRDQTASRERPLEDRARLAFADPANEFAPRNRDFLFHAFDTWTDTDPTDEFSRLFTANGEGGGPLPLLVSASPDLFGSCLASYGEDFTYAETLMLFAVLIARMGDPVIDAKLLEERLRSIRNLAESAFLEGKRMSEYIATVERLITDGTLEGAQGFAAGWVADERLKQEFLNAHPEATSAVRLLEDHMVIRGRLFAFDLDADTIAKRASGFVKVAHPEARDLFGAALLTKGDYSRDLGWNGQRRQLGSSTKDDSWRDIFTAGTRDQVGRTREPLMMLLDDVDARLSVRETSAADVLQAICADWIAEREATKRFDWRYYLVRYEGARSSIGDGYFNGSYGPEHAGFSVERLRMLHGSNYQAYFSDALLKAAWVEGNLADMANKPSWWRQDDPGMVMKKSGIEIRSVEDGLQLSIPGDEPAPTGPVLEALSGFRASKDALILAERETYCANDGTPTIDSEDRVQLCVRLVTTLHEAGY